MMSIIISKATPCNSVKLHRERVIAREGERGRERKRERERERERKREVRESKANTLIY